MREGIRNYNVTGFGDPEYVTSVLTSVRNLSSDATVRMAFDDFMAEIQAGTLKIAKAPTRDLEEAAVSVLNHLSGAFECCPICREGGGEHNEDYPCFALSEAVPST